MDATASGELPLWCFRGQIQRINCSSGYKIFFSERWAKPDRTAGWHSNRNAAARQFRGSAASGHSRGSAADGHAAWFGNSSCRNRRSLGKIECRKLARWISMDLGVIGEFSRGSLAAHESYAGAFIPARSFPAKADVIEWNTASPHAGFTIAVPGFDASCSAASTADSIRLLPPAIWISQIETV